MDGKVEGGWRDKQCIYNCCELVLKSSTYESAFNEDVMLHRKVHCIVVCIITFTQSKSDHSMHANLITGVYLLTIDQLYESFVMVICDSEGPWIKCIS